MTQLHHALALLGSVGGRVESLDGRFVAIAVAFHVLNLVLRATAWRNALAAAYPEERVPRVAVGAAYAAGVAFNGFLPGRAGEAAKVALVRMQIPRSSVVTIASSNSVILLLDAVLGIGLLTAAWTLGLVPSPPRPPHLQAASALVSNAWLGAAAAAAVVICAAIVGRRARPLVRALLARVADGLSILRSPRTYGTGVAAPQLGAWMCRIGFTFALLLAFGLPATIPLAATIVVVGGMSTLVPATPGGMGTQQVLLVYVLHTVTTTAQAVAFSVGLQLGVTVVNALIGCAAVMVAFRTLRPLAAVRAAKRA